MIPDDYLVGYDGQWLPAKPIVLPIPETLISQQKQIESEHNKEPLKSLEEMEEYVNTHINKQHISDKFIKLLNEELKAQGITTVTDSLILFKGENIRAKEQKISFGHTRPNGEDCCSVFPKEERFTFRTLLKNSAIIGFYKTLEQVAAAKEMFNGWKRSPTYYEVMMVNDDLQSTVSVHLRVTDFFQNKIL